MQGFLGKPFQLSEVTNSQPNLVLNSSLHYWFGVNVQFWLSMVLLLIYTYIILSAGFMARMPRMPLLAIQKHHRQKQNRLINFQDSLQYIPGIF